MKITECPNPCPRKLTVTDLRPGEAFRFVQGKIHGNTFEGIFIRINSMNMTNVRLSDGQVGADTTHEVERVAAEVVVK